MEVNVGKFDKKVRITAGALLILVSLASFLNYLEYGPGMEWTAMILGLVLVVTGVMRKCFLYKLVGVNSCEME